MISFMVSYFLATEEKTSPTKGQRVEELGRQTHFFFLFGGDGAEAEVRGFIVGGFV
jgi:hypothetical protein